MQCNSMSIILGKTTITIASCDIVAVDYRADIGRVWITLADGSEIHLPSTVANALYTKVAAERNLRKNTKGGV